MAKKKVVLTFPPDVVAKPITYHLVKDFDLITNILRAEVHEEETGLLILDLEGEPANIEAGLEFLREQGVDVQEAAKDINLDKELCVDCGACIVVCHNQALVMDKDTFELELQKDACILCELCVKACPVRAIKVDF